MAQSSVQRQYQWKRPSYESKMRPKSTLSLGAGTEATATLMRTANSEVLSLDRPDGAETQMAPIVEAPIGIADDLYDE